MMLASTIRFSTFPRTESQPNFLPSIVSVFTRHHDDIATTQLAKGLTSDVVLERLREDLMALERRSSVVTAATRR